MASAEAPLSTSEDVRFADCPRLGSRRAACKALGVSMSTLIRLIEQGALPVVRIRHRVLIDPADLEAFIARSKVA